MLSLVIEASIMILMEFRYLGSTAAVDVNPPVMWQCDPDSVWADSEQPNAQVLKLQRYVH